MSTWTEVTGIIRCDWYPMSSNTTKVFEEWHNRIELLKEVFAEEKSPHGTEDSYIKGIIAEKTLQISDLNTIVLLGSLRDFGEEEIVTQVVPYWERIINELPGIRQAVMTCTCNGKTHIFEKRISADCDLVKPDSPSWYPDPGIVVHTERTVQKAK